jgi:hypothetical protein
MSADNRGGGVTYRERKRKKEGRRPAFFLGLLFFCLRGTGGGLPTGKEKEGRRLAFFLALPFFLLRGTGGGDSRDRRSLVGYWVQRVNCETCWVGPGGVGTDGGGRGRRLFICLFISNDVKCMAGYCVLFSSSLSFFLALAPLHPRYLSGRYVLGR